MIATDRIAVGKKINPSYSPAVIIVYPTVPWTLASHSPNCTSVRSAVLQQWGSPVYSTDRQTDHATSVTIGRSLCYTQRRDQIMRRRLNLVSCFGVISLVLTELFYVRLRFVYSIYELDWTEPTCSKPTQLHDAFIGHARQRHDLIGCSETRTLGAQRILDTSRPIPVQPFTLEFANLSSVDNITYSFITICQTPAVHES